MTPVLRKLLGAATVAALLFVTGCGGGDPPPPGTPSAAENLLTLAKVHEQPQGSPEEALLRWWMHIQYNDLHGYLSDIATPLRHRREAEGQTRRNLLLVSGDSLRSQPRFGGSQREANAVTLFTRIETRQPVGASRFTTSSTPQAFTLIHEGGRWVIADDSYVLDRATVIREALENAKKAR
ncbi:MAG: hypothetical protein QOF85_1267 [Solirubrobacterales bacterium]|jgi:hypothetical protein|nr:hypothetical protein [Solirubrobacterales bacterium]